MQQSQTEALGKEPVGRLLMRLAAPAVAAQVINLLYNPGGPHVHWAHS